MRENRPLLSVWMISYNHEKYIEQALNSVLMQKTKFEYEIVIGDDCSTDNTQQILRTYAEKYPDKITLILRDKNMGPTNNAYDVFMNCRGKYIALLEGDDFWTDNEKLQKQVDILESDSELSGCSHIVNYIDGNNKIFDQEPSNKFIDQLKIICGPEDFIKYTLNGVSICHTQSLVFRNFFKSGDFRELITCAKYICDTQLKILILSYGKLHLINNNMGCYRYITNSTSFSSLSYEAKFNDMTKVWNEVDKFLEYRHSNLINLIKKRNLEYKFINFFLNKYYKQAFKLWLSDLNLSSKLISIKLLAVQQIKSILKFDK